MSAARHILMALMLVCLLASCSGRPRIIPKSTLTDIYAEMFLADQWLADHNSEKRKVDTMLFYDPIFRRYGYTFEDYDATVQRYLKDPEKFSRVFRDAAAKLKKGEKRFKKEIDRLESIREFNAAIKGYSEKNFDYDTLLWRTTYKDSLRLIALKRDSLLKDSLLRDSLVRDSLVRDSIRTDSLAKAVLVRDSIRRTRHINKFDRKLLTN